MERKTMRFDGNNNVESTHKEDDRRYFIAETSANIEDVRSNGEASDDDSVTYAEMNSVSRIASDEDAPTEVEDKTVSSSEADDMESHRNDAKPSQSYIALIAMAILSAPERKMVLSDIYGFIIENFPFYKTQDKSWRNSIRHNLSLNECFIKAGRSMNGKGNYWAIHPSNEEDFSKGDFRRRRTRRKLKRSAYPLGLYSELFRPYYAAASKYPADYRVSPHIWGANDMRPRAKSDESYLMAASPPASMQQKISKQRPKKSFTIDSILGKDTENEDLKSQKSKAQLQSRRHYSWTSSPAARSHSPYYESYGSQYSPIYSHFTFEPVSPYSPSQEAYRRFETIPPLMSPYLRDTIRDFSRLRAYSLK